VQENVQDALALLQEGQYSLLVTPMLETPLHYLADEIECMELDLADLDRQNRNLVSLLVERQEASRIFLRQLNPQQAVEAAFTEVYAKIAACEKELEEEETLLIQTNEGLLEEQRQTLVLQEEVDALMANYSILINNVRKDETFIEELLRKHQCEIQPLQEKVNKAEELASKMKEWQTREIRLRGDLERLEKEREALQKYETKSIDIQEEEGEDIFYW